MRVSASEPHHANNGERGLLTLTSIRAVRDWIFAPLRALPCC